MRWDRDSDYQRGFEIWWLGSRGSRVQISGFRVQGSGFRVQGAGFRVWFWVLGFQRPQLSTNQTIRTVVYAGFVGAGVGGVT